MSLFSPIEFRLEIIEELSSTNAFLLEQSSQENFHGRAIMARRQTAGVGRRGRSWSTLEGNLALSFGVVWKSTGFVSLLPFLTGIALFDTVQGYLPKDAKLSLKWPNDIYLNDMKLGGMLSQAKQLGGDVRLVIGIGLNIAQAPVETRVPAISLAQATNHFPTAEALANLLLQNLETAFLRLSSAEKICREWETRCSHIGREIMYFPPEDSENKKMALAKSLALNGELVVREQNGAMRNLSGEEVSLELLL